MAKGRKEGFCLLVTKSTKKEIHKRIVAVGSTVFLFLFFNIKK